MPETDGGPTYPLEDVQELVRQRLYRITVSASRGASSLYLDEADIVECVLELDQGDFHKTMEAEQRPGLFQDVYFTRYQSRNIYVKVQVQNSRTAVVISFKKNESA